MIDKVRQLKLLNLNCREASRLASEALDRRLTFLERWGLRLHLMICTSCRAWRRQVRLIRRAMREQLRYVDEATDTSRVELTAEARQRIRNAIDEHS